MSECKQQWFPPGDSRLWWRFLAAGQQLRQRAPLLFPLVVELVEGVAEPDGLTNDDLIELAATAAHTAWSLPAPAPAPPAGPVIPPARALADWRLVDEEAHAVPLDRMEMLGPEFVAQIAEWARAVARARKDPAITVPLRPPIVEQLLAEVEPPGNRE